MSVLARTGVGVSSMQEVFQLARELSEARGFVPDQFIGKPAALAAAILMGVELGMGAMESIRAIHVIKGKPSLSAETMLARARLAGYETYWTHTDARSATLEITDRKGRKLLPMTFTIADATAAGLAGSENWKKHTAAMLRARCTSAAMRAHCPEVLGSGIYTPEELDSNVRVDSQGEVIVTVDPPREERAQEGPRLEAPKVRKLSECVDKDSFGTWCESQRGVPVEKHERLRMGIEAHAAKLGIGAEEVLIFIDLAGIAISPKATHDHDADSGEVAAEDEQ